MNDQVTGLVIIPDSIDEAEEAIVYLATHPRKCAEMAAKAYETARGSFEIGSKVRTQSRDSWLSGEPRLAVVVSS